MSLFLPIISALWLGIVTSVSPCPLSTNVAAITILSRKVGNRKMAILGSFFYTLGRVSVYVLLSLIIMAGVASMPELSRFLSKNIKPFIGPVLILAGMLIAGWLPFQFSWRIGSEKTAKSFSNLGLFGEFFIGALFALSFCPVSAALFFGSLIPMAIKSNVPSLLIVIYGFGTALPVGIIATLLVLSTEKAASLVSNIQIIQKPLIKITSLILISIGLWLTFKSLFH